MEVLITKHEGECYMVNFDEKEKKFTRGNPISAVNEPYKMSSEWGEIEISPTCELLIQDKTGNSMKPIPVINPNTDNPFI